MKKIMIKLAAAVIVAVGVFAGTAQMDAGIAWAAEQETQGYQFAEYAPVELKNGTYTVNVDLEAGEGISEIRTETSIFVENKEATVVIVWDSTDYNYMVIDGEKFLPKSAEGGCVFWVPVTAWDEEIPVIVSRGAGSTEETECTLFLDSSTIKKQGTMAPLYALIVLNIILAFLNGLNMVRKKKLFVERVETAKETEKFARQYEKRTGQVYKRQNAGQTPGQMSGQGAGGQAAQQDGDSLLAAGFIPKRRMKNAADESQNSAGTQAQGSRTSAKSPYASGYQPQSAQPAGLWWRRSPDEPGTLVEIKREEKSEEKPEDKKENN